MTSIFPPLTTICHLHKPKHSPSKYPFLNPNVPKHNHSCNVVLYCRSRESSDTLAEQLFDNMPSRDKDSCSSLIAWHARQRNVNVTFGLFIDMICQGLMPDEVAIESLIRLSSDCSDGSVLGSQMHGWIICSGLRLNRNIRAALIFMYSGHEKMFNARKVFDEIPVDAAEVLEWESIIVAYVRWARWIHAFVLFNAMLFVGVILPTLMTYASIVTACGSAREEKYGGMVHGTLIKHGLQLQDATMLWNTVITMYSKFGNVKAAKKVFEHIYKKDVVSWNAVIAAHEQNGEESSALVLFRRMLRTEGTLQPNRITFLSVISSFSACSGLKLGKEMHAQIIRQVLDSNCSIANALIKIYSKCGQIEYAETIFEKLHVKDTISWNTMLSGYEQNEQLEKFLSLYSSLLQSGAHLDSHCFTIFLKAISRDPLDASFLNICRTVHGYILKSHIHAEASLPVYNALITAYGKFNLLVDVVKIFDRMPERDTISWNAKMDAYSSNSMFDEAIGTFKDMLEHGVHLDQSSFLIILSACSRLVSLELGKQLHSVIAKLVNHKDLAQSKQCVPICNSLLSMYSKCGEIDDAERVLSIIETADVFTWTAMITGYAYHGMAKRSLHIYEKMLNNGVQPNHVTFLGILTACAHSGLVEDGVRFFNSMSQDHNLSPKMEHYACLVDLYSRSGQFERAVSVIQSVISIFGTEAAGTANIYRVLLGACHAQNKFELGISTASKILKLEPNDEATYILLANLYTASGQWEEAIMIRETIIQKGLSKEAGCSWIEVGKTRHVFVCGDICHPRRKDIYNKLMELNSGRGERL